MNSELVHTRAGKCGDRVHRRREQAAAIVCDIILIGQVVVNILEFTLSPDQKRRALEQALQGTTFSRADQLKRFLRYVCEMEIAGRAPEIKEYSIATEALGHSADYSPSDGSSVRSRAHSLRQKLQE